MAGYRDELERLNFSAEEKEALTCRLLERRSGQEEKRPRFPYRGLMAIVAAASLLTGAVGAVSLAGVSPAFRELFGITSEEQAKNLGIVLDGTRNFEDKNGSGATVTVKEAAADQEQFYILVEFAAPEGTVLPEPDQVEEGFIRAVLWGGPDGGESASGLWDPSCTNFIGSRQGMQ